jgi:hypothetical protein
LVSDCQVLDLLRQQRVFSEKHGLLSCFTDIGLPVTVRVIEGINKLFISFEVVQGLSVFRNEVVYLLVLCFEGVEFGDQRLLYFELVFHCILSLFCLFLDTLDKLMHELDVVLEVQLMSLQSLFVVFDGVLELGRLLFFDYYVHFGQVDLLLLLEELMDRLFLL